MKIQKKIFFWGWGSGGEGRVGGGGCQGGCERRIEVFVKIQKKKFGGGRGGGGGGGRDGCDLRIKVFGKIHKKEIGGGSGGGGRVCGVGSGWM